MKSIKEYREAWAKRKGYNDWNDVIATCGSAPTLITNIFDEVTKGYSIELGKQALKNASENAKLDTEWNHSIGDVAFSVDKKSILDENNIPKI